MPIIARHQTSSAVRAAGKSKRLVFDEAWQQNFDLSSDLVSQARPHLIAGSWQGTFEK